MKLLHAGLVCSSAPNADLFFGELLGLVKQSPKELPREISKALFGVDAALTMINYVGAAAHFEVFIHDAPSRATDGITHVCIEVESLEPFLQKCRGLNLRVNQVPKGTTVLTFIQDFDNNLYEIKAKA